VPAGFSFCECLYFLLTSAPFRQHRHQWQYYTGADTELYCSNTSGRGPLREDVSSLDGLLDGGALEVGQLLAREREHGGPLAVLPRPPCTWPRSRCRRRGASSAGWASRGTTSGAPQAAGQTKHRQRQCISQGRHWLHQQQVGHDKDLSRLGRTRICHYALPPGHCRVRLLTW